jgi:NTE family protein
MTPTIHRALIFQGGGSLGAYEAGSYKAIHESLSSSYKAEGRETSQYSISYLEPQ